MMMMITVCPLTAKLILKAGNVQVRIGLQPTTFQCILYLKILAAPRGASLFEGSKVHITAGLDLPMVEIL